MNEITHTYIVTCFNLWLTYSTSFPWELTMCQEQWWAEGTHPACLWQIFISSCHISAKSAHELGECREEATVTCGIKKKNWFLIATTSRLCDSRHTAWPLCASTFPISNVGMITASIGAIVSILWTNPDKPLTTGLGTKSTLHECCFHCWDTVSVVL